MDLALLSSSEIIALVDEEVAPLAAELGRILAARGADLRGVIGSYFRAFAVASGDGERRELLQLAAAVMLALAAAKRWPALAQRPDTVRVVRLQREPFNAFRLGALRHLTFRKGMYDVPKIGNVVRLVETDDGRASGAEALAEITYVVTHDGDDDRAIYSVSVRPWRGAGTEGSDIAFMLDRAKSLADLEEVLTSLVDVTTGSQQTKLRAAALRVLGRVRDLTVVQVPAAAE